MIPDGAVSVILTISQIINFAGIFLIASAILKRKGKVDDRTSIQKEYGLPETPDGLYVNDSTFGSKQRVSKAIEKVKQLAGASWAYIGGKYGDFKDQIDEYIKDANLAEAFDILGMPLKRGKYRRKPVSHAWQHVLTKRAKFIERIDALLKIAKLVTNDSSGEPKIDSIQLDRFMHEMNGILQLRVDHATPLKGEDLHGRTKLKAPKKESDNIQSSEFCVADPLIHLHVILEQRPGTKEFEKGWVEAAVPGILDVATLQHAKELVKQYKVMDTIADTDHTVRLDKQNKCFLLIKAELEKLKVALEAHNPVLDEEQQGKLLFAVADNFSKLAEYHLYTYSWKIALVKFVEWKDAVAWNKHWQQDNFSTVDVKAPRWKRASRREMFDLVSKMHNIVEHDGKQYLKDGLHLLLFQGTVRNSNEHYIFSFQKLLNAEYSKPGPVQKIIQMQRKLADPAVDVKAVRAEVQALHDEYEEYRNIVRHAYNKLALNFCQRRPHLVYDHGLHASWCLVDKDENGIKFSEYNKVDYVEDTVDTGVEDFLKNKQDVAKNLITAIDTLKHSFTFANYENLMTHFVVDGTNVYPDSLIFGADADWMDHAKSELGEDYLFNVTVSSLVEQNMFTIPFDTDIKTKVLAQLYVLRDKVEKRSKLEFQPHEKKLIQQKTYSPYKISLGLDPQSHINYLANLQNHRQNKKFEDVLDEIMSNPRPFLDAGAWNAYFDMVVRWYLASKFLSRDNFWGSYYKPNLDTLRSVVKANTVFANEVIKQNHAGDLDTAKLDSLLKAYLAMDVTLPAGTDLLYKIQYNNGTKTDLLLELVTLQHKEPLVRLKHLLGHSLNEEDLNVLSTHLNERMSQYKALAGYCKQNPLDPLKLYEFLGMVKSLGGFKTLHGEYLYTTSPSVQIKVEFRDPTIDLLAYTASAMHHKRHTPILAKVSDTIKTRYGYDKSASGNIESLCKLFNPGKQGDFKHLAELHEGHGIHSWVLDIENAKGSTLSSLCYGLSEIIQAQYHILEELNKLVPTHKEYLVELYSVTKGEVGTPLTFNKPVFEDAARYRTKGHARENHGWYEEFKLSRRQIRFIEKLESNPRTDLQKIKQYNEVMKNENSLLYKDLELWQKLRDHLAHPGLINMTDVVPSDFPLSKIENDLSTLQDMFGTNGKTIMRGESLRYSYYLRFKRKTKNLIKDWQELINLIKKCQKKADETNLNELRDHLNKDVKQMRKDVLYDAAEMKESNERITHAIDYLLTKKNVVGPEK